MSLHALAYCRRIFYLEEVEEIRVADDRVNTGRELHASLTADEEGDRTQLELADRELGLFGKVGAGAGTDRFCPTSTSAGGAVAAACRVV
jgi:CRISPR-associated protein Cas1